MMTPIHKIIIDTIQARDVADIASAMGYVPTEKFETRFLEMMKSPYLGLDKAKFDGVYASERFLDKLLDVLGLEEVRSSEELDAIRFRANDEQFGFRPWLFIDTNFKRKSEPVFALAFLEGTRRAALPKSLKFMNKSELHEYLAFFIKVYMKLMRGESVDIASLPDDVQKHLPWHAFTMDKSSDKLGKLTIWGKPVGFYCHLSENYVLKLDLVGRVLDDTDQEVVHSEAILQLG